MDDEKNVVRCHNCGRVIGRVKNFRNRKDLLEIDGILFSIVRGVCIYCGTEFHWSISEQTLTKLIRQKGNL